MWDQLGYQLAIGALAFLFNAHNPPIPGTTDPAVTQENVQRTVCVRGYTDKVRPPVEVTERIKRELTPPGHKPSEYELDHLVPLELGGAALDRKNLWLQAWDDAKRKDREEDRLHRLVCSGAMTLKEAQRSITHSW